MNIDLSFLKRKVARRILIQFVFCALIPIIVLAFVSFFQVRAELERQGKHRLHDATRAMGTSVYERILSIENNMKILSIELNLRFGNKVRANGQKYIEHFHRPLKALALVTDTGKTVSFFGKAPALPRQTAKQQKHFLSGKTLLFTSSDRDGNRHIGMMRAVDPQNPGRGHLIGELNSMYLWGLDDHNTLPAMTELSVLDSRGNVFFSTISTPPEFSRRPEFKRSRSARSDFRWEYEGEPYQAAYWSVFMNYQWAYPKLIVVMSTPRRHMFAPIAFFKKIFPLVILLSLWVVLLLSIIQIRRITEPLKALTESTQRISNQDFDSRVSVASGDEFEELGRSFNEMANQLKRQFMALATIGEIERAVLGSLDSEKILITVTNHMGEIFSNDLVGAALLDSENKNKARFFVKGIAPGMAGVFKNITLSKKDKQSLYDNPEIRSVDRKDGFPGYLAPVGEKGVQKFVIIPLFVKGVLAGFIALGLRDPGRYQPDDLEQVRQIANQVAVALSNAQLLEELDLMNWGALTALARAVDAKSPWTAGHSERVTKMAIEIGRGLGLSDDEIENLHRAALLHDIGKIATPASILEKSGKLTDAERQIVEAHSSEGARILDPIEAYKSLIPAVLQHHERYDGKGYPDGLAGKEISLGGRIMAVADVYDALVSDRPYRDGMDKDRVVAIIKEDTGTHFDPEVVQVFLAVINQESEPEGDYGKKEKLISVAAS
jgi:putative nucleotidyltransferase with HDIG domain